MPQATTGMWGHPAMGGPLLLPLPVQARGTQNGLRSAQAAAGGPANGMTRNMELEALYQQRAGWGTGGGTFKDEKNIPNELGSL